MSAQVKQQQHLAHIRGIHSELHSSCQHTKQYAMEVIIADYGQGRTPEKAVKKSLTTDH